MPIYTGITQERLFSEQTLKHYESSRSGYNGKKIDFFVAQFLGKREEIVLGDDLTEKGWFRKDKLIDLIYPESREQTIQIIKFMEERGLIQ